ncbi:MAG: hypothetical protein KTR16_16360 [Acidiferrobacterales bacterium]|nr:hypothetical protein [Acidiferrobacterales bacterium]
MSEPEVKMLSNRAFGLIFAGIFLVICFFPLIFGNEYRGWALIVSAAFAAPAIFIPRVLTPLNKLWMKFGFFMHTIINPLLMGLVFFLTVLPTGLILKLLGKDPMNRKFEANSKTYWIARNEKISKESFDNQF